MATSNKSEGLTLENDGESGIFRISISDEHFTFKEVEIADRKVTGAQIAEAAGAHPVQDFVILQHLKSGELESLRPTEITNLGEKGVERYFVIRGDELFRFVVEGLCMEWPRPKISGRHIKFLARLQADEDFNLVLDLPGGDRVIGDDDYIDLQMPGMEELRFHKKPRKVKVIFDQEKIFELDARDYTTEELIKVFSVTPGYILDIVVDGKLVDLKSGESICVREGMEFSAHPPRGKSS